MLVALRLLPYAATALAVWWVMDMRADLKAAAARIDNLTMQLAGCRARAENLTEDKESDDAIDNLTDDDLRTAPDGWMLPPIGGSGSLY